MSDSPNSWRKHLMLWAAAPIVLISLVLTPLAVLQYKQYQSLTQQPQYENDSVIMLAYQLERETLRFALALEQYTSTPPNVQASELLRRFDIFYSRVNLLEHNPGAAVIEATADYALGMQAIHGLIDSAAPSFASLQALQATNRASLNQLRVRTESLLVTMARVTFAANNAVYVNFDERNALLREQSTLIVVLTVAQAGLLIIAAIATLQYLRRGHQQVEELTALTQDLQTARDNAEAASKSKSVFLANMSHEIRTPFQGLLGMINLLLQTRLDTRQKDYLATAQQSAQHLLGVVNDVLDISTIESGNLRLHNAPVDVAALVNEVSGLMRAQANAKGLALKVRLAPNTPTHVMTDGMRLRQIMFNLLSNAIKFTHQGYVQFDVGPIKELDSGLDISVCDTGIGMCNDTLDQLFTRFFQAEESATKRFQGTGLGLEISRTLIRYMNGTLEVTSELGKGSRFRAVLPLADAALTTHESSPNDLTAQALEATSNTLRVLVAEDHPINLKVLAILLERMGHRATLCKSGQEAIDMLQHQSFDVILLDYHMPDMDGLQAAQHIRALPHPLGNTPIVLVTADVVHGTRARAMQAGVTAFTPKPVGLHDLQATFIACGLVDNAAQHQAILPEHTDMGIKPSHAKPQPTSTLMDYLLQDTPLLDKHKFNELFELLPLDNWDTMRATLFDAPAGDVPTLLTMLHQQAPNDALSEQAHKVKGAALLIGLQRLGELCAALEEQCSAAQSNIDGPAVEPLAHANAHSALAATGKATAAALELALASA